MEAAWAYQHRPNVTGFLLRRQKSLALSDEVKQIAWKAQYRLHKRYKAFAARGKNKNQIVTAFGRELLGFIWAIAVKDRTAAEARSSSLKTATRDVFLDSSADDSAGPTKRRTLLCSMRNGLRPQPARLVRGSSRRIMSMRFRPANIRVINRRASSSAVIGPAVQPNAQSSPAGTCSRYAARRSRLRCQNGARRQGFASPRQKAARPCRLRAVPAKAIIATGGSGGNTSR